MIDMHYDLLSILYHSYKRNDYSYIKKIQEYYQENGIRGVVANLYFMNEEEMREEFGSYYETINAVEMFRISTALYHKYFPRIPVVFSIEGMDYINSIAELEELYQLGLRNMLLVWNNSNRYGSGNCSTKGLTVAGIQMIKAAIDLGISIDLSHMNVTTFYDTIGVLKEEKAKGKKVKVIASHSNCYKLYSHIRNLSDEQLLAMKEFQPVVGIVSYGPFVSFKQDRKKLIQQYLEHVIHIEELLGIECVGISTDDMEFGRVLFGEDEVLSIFKYSNIVQEVTKLLEKRYSRKDIEQILYQNSYDKLFKRE